MLAASIGQRRIAGGEVGFDALLAVVDIEDHPARVAFATLARFKYQLLQAEH